MPRRIRVPPPLASLIPALAVLALLPPAVSGQGLEIRGRVTDRLTGTSVEGAEVSLNAGAARVATAADGTFTIGNLRPGSYTVQVVRFGYASYELAAVVAGGGPLEISLSPAAIRLSEITVSPGTFSFGGATPTARQTMTRAELDAVPQFAEDIFRAANRLPGLSSPDFTSRFSIRGGRPDETLIRIDGLEIYEPYHLKDFQDGAISIFDSEVVDGFELMTGGFPVRYGNHTGGVFNIHTREPEDGRTRIGVGASLLNARVLAEGTFDDGRGSFLVSGRRGYVDLILRVVGESRLPSPAYHDVLGKVKYRVGGSHSLALSVLHAGDGWTFDARETTGFLDSIDTREDTRNRYGNRYAWVTHESLLGDRAFVRTIASVGRVTSTRDGGEYYASDGAPIYDIRARRDFTVRGVTQEWTLDVAERVALEAGVDLRDVEAEYATRATVTQDPDNPYPDAADFFPRTERDSLGLTSSSVGAYVSARLRAVDPVTLEVGGRYDRARHTGDRDFSPRVHALIDLGGGTTVRAGWGLFRQTQRLWEVSILDPSQRFYGSERSRQWTASVEHAFADGGLLRIEGYRRRGDRLRPRYRNWKAGIDVFPESNEDRILVRPATSSSRGVEAYVQRPLSDRLAIRASYALAQAQERVLDIENVNDPRPLAFDSEHGAPRDQRHAVNLDVTYRPWQAWSLTTSYTFHSGWPTTLQRIEEITTEDGGSETVLLPDPIYGARVPAYHRIDTRLTKRSRYRGGDLRIFFEVSNLTNRTNVFGWDYARVPAPGGGIGLEREPEGGFVILPSLGVSWTGWR